MILMKLFSQNPFRSLHDHMEKTMECVEKVEKLFEALFLGDKDLVHSLSREISALEHDCDIIKQEIRAHLRKSALLGKPPGSCPLCRGW